MKRLPLIIGFILVTVTVWSQSLDVLQAPQSPAFQLMGISPTTVERPSDVTDVMVSALQATDDFTRFPSNYAVEIAPVNLFRKKQTERFENFLRDDSVANNIAQSFLISVGTTTHNSEVLGRDISRLGMGLKFSFFRGKADTEPLFKSDDFKKLGAITSEINENTLDTIQTDPKMVGWKKELYQLKFPATSRKNAKEWNLIISTNIEKIDSSLYYLYDFLKLNNGDPSPNPTTTELLIEGKLRNLAYDTVRWVSIIKRLEHLVIDTIRPNVRLSELDDIWIRLDSTLSSISGKVTSLKSSIPNQPSNSELFLKLRLRDADEEIKEAKTSIKASYDDFNEGRLFGDDLELAKAKIDTLMQKWADTLTVKLADIMRNELEEYEKTMRALKVNRYGFKLDLAAGTVLDFPSQAYDFSYLTETGIWLTGGWDWKKGSSLLGMAIFIGNANQYYINDSNMVATRQRLNLDLGLKYVFSSSKKINIQGELVGRKFLYDSETSSKRFFDDYKLAVTVDYKWSANQIVSLTFGKDLSNYHDLTQESLLLALNVVLGIGSNRGSVSKAFENQLKSMTQ